MYMKRKLQHKKLRRNQNKEVEDYQTQDISQKIKELITADPTLVDTLQDGVVKEEIKNVREMAKEEGKIGVTA